MFNRHSTLPPTEGNICAQKLVPQWLDKNRTNTSIFIKIEIMVIAKIGLQRLLRIRETGRSRRKERRRDICIWVRIMMIAIFAMTRSITLMLTMTSITNLTILLTTLNHTQILAVTPTSQSYLSHQHNFNNSNN